MELKVCDYSSRGWKHTSVCNEGVGVLCMPESKKEYAVIRCTP
jgi:hypothetical protein